MTNRRREKGSLAIWLSVHTFIQFGVWNLKASYVLFMDLGRLLVHIVYNRGQRYSVAQCAHPDI
jgi:hypothetical protein